MPRTQGGLVKGRLTKLELVEFAKELISERGPVTARQIGDELRKRGDHLSSVSISQGLSRRAKRYGLTVIDATPRQFDLEG